MSDTPRRYRKLPIEVTAVQWTGDNFPEVCEFADAERIRVEVPGELLRLWIEKSQTWGVVRAGDWVIAERDGIGFYPCVATEFEATFEAVE